MAMMIAVDKKITINELKRIASKSFGNLVKAVVDIKKETMVIGGDLHSDEEALLLSQGSEQEDLWGINLYPDLDGGEFIEFDSMINIRPTLNNLSRGIDDSTKREKIINVVKKLVK